ncbi:hypothetical protein [Kozakia baliensis]|uniref:hypothetical protein n=1 Tax=Kozakia baliensis TaxID=153496 RepID=UPI00117004A0|nr:hypothetical protein [Kozakia baliensis]GBR27146.1 hypothetical protein AA0488_1057 [Kozakia baliensis NRIC 0488]GEL64078.1 hypothetical protein KBA01_13640 [Kozakia baliensis]
MSGPNIRIALFESGSFEETDEHEALNAVKASGMLASSDIQEAREQKNKHQIKVWTTKTQKFGVRCRVLGGSTAGWAGKVAPFDAIDFEPRSWVSNSGWPIDQSERFSKKR